MQIRILLKLIFLNLVLSGKAQIINPPHNFTNKFEQARKHFMQEDWQLAYPLFCELKSDKSNLTLSQKEDLEYYILSTQVNLRQESGVKNALQWLEYNNNAALAKLMNFYLGHYYFLKNDAEKCIQYYSNTDIQHLENEQIANAKYEKGYSYFSLKDYANAEDLLNEVSQLENNKYHIDASYYYGFLCYYNKRYTQALKEFSKVTNHPVYGMLTPYYVAEMNYQLGKKDEALNYALKYANDENIGQYNDLQQLIGQIYFEKKEFEKALPYFEKYAAKQSKISPEYLYQISYCHYVAKNWEKATSGLKVLSTRKDTLGQNAMYLLGDCYIKTNQKENARTAFLYCSQNNSKQKEQEVASFLYGKLSYELGYNDVAMQSLKAFIAKYPSSIFTTEAKDWLVLALTQTSNFREALSTYEEIDYPSENSKKAYPRILLGRGIQLIQDAEINEAELLLEKCLKNNPTEYSRALANYWLGEINYRQLDYDLAANYFEQYIGSKLGGKEGDANLDFAKYNLAYCYYQKANYNKAFPFFEEVGKSQTVSNIVQKDALLRSADMHFMNKRMANAEAIYKQFVDNKYQDDDYAYYQLAIINGIKNQNAKIETLKKLGDLYPKSNLVVKSNLEISKAYMASEKYQDAVLYLDKILTQNPPLDLLPQVLLNKGVCYFNIDDYDKALPPLVQLVKENKESPEADIALPYISTIYVEKGNAKGYEDLMTSIGKNLQTNEADSLNYAAAVSKYNQGNCKESINALSNYIQKFPNSPNVLNAIYFRSECYTKIKDTFNLLKDYETITALGKNKYYNKAAITAARIYYFDYKDFKNAEKYYTLCYQHISDEAIRLEAIRGLVRCANYNKDYSTASLYCNELLANKKSTKDDKAIAQLVLAETNLKQGKIDEALKAFTDCAAIHKGEWGAESRYQIAKIYFSKNELQRAEKAALRCIKETGSYEYWMNSAYILLGDISLAQKDYFNALATYESVANNSKIDELRKIARGKYNEAKKEGERNGSIATENNNATTNN